MARRFLDYDIAEWSRLHSWWRYVYTRGHALYETGPVAQPARADAVCTDGSVDMDQLSDAESHIARMQDER